MALKNKFTFNWVYGLLAVLLFLVEFLIERYTHDAFIRPYFGDFLVVILLYTLIKTIWNSKPIPTALAVLLYAFLLEFSQYLELSRKLGVETSWIGRLILGNYFAWGDLLAYTGGIALVILLESVFKPRTERNQSYQ